MSGYDLNRLKQCAKCPWKKKTNPHEIPNGYSAELHKRLQCTIAEPASLRFNSNAMACHESAPGDETYCIGWLMHQLGPGNNIGLRIKMMGRDLRAIELDGEQHDCFEDTLPSSESRKPR